jgi:hypothetical protein
MYRNVHISKESVANARKSGPYAGKSGPRFACATTGKAARGGDSVRCRSYASAHRPQEEVPAVAGQREAHELLLIEEADAWFEYLEATRGQTAVRYKEVEPWAWARLSQRLRAIRTRRAKLRPAAAA